MSQFEPKRERDSDGPEGSFYEELTALDKQAAAAKSPEKQRQQVHPLIELAEQTWRLYHADENDQTLSDTDQEAQLLLNAELIGLEQEAADFSEINNLNEGHLHTLRDSIKKVTQRWRVAAAQNESLRQHTAAEVRRLTDEIETHFSNISDFNQDQAARIQALHDWQNQTAIPTVEEIENTLRLWYEFKNELGQS